MPRKHSITMGVDLEQWEEIGRVSEQLKVPRAELVRLAINAICARTCRLEGLALAKEFQHLLMITSEAMRRAAEDRTPEEMQAELVKMPALPPRGGCDG